MRDESNLEAYERVCMCEYICMSEYICTCVYVYISTYEISERDM